MWCTNDVSFIFVVGWGVLGIGDGDGDSGIEERMPVKKRVARERAKNRGIYHALLKKAAFP